MDWICITTSCFAVSNAIAKTSRTLHAFVREVRESRSDLHGISSELHSLDAVLDLLKDDAVSFPPQLARQTPAVLRKCLTLISELEGCISVLDRSGLSRSDKKSRWMASRGHITKLGWTLEGYKSSLGLALDLDVLIAPPSSRSSDSSAQQYLVDRNEVATVMSQIRRMMTRLQGESQQNGAVLTLKVYLDALHAHALAALSVELDRLEIRRTSSSVSDPPDSAIEMGDEPIFPAAKRSDPQTFGIPIEEIDELLDELRDMPGRPPTPPPRAAARADSLRSSLESPLNRRPSTAGSHYSSAHKPPGSLNSWGVSSTGLRQRTPSSFCTPVTDLASDNQSISSSGNGHTREFDGHIRTVSDTAELRPSTANGYQSLVRRRSSRLSATFKNMKLKLPLKATDCENVPEPDCIFGVSLEKSIQIARGIAGTRHGGGGASTGDYPLCVLRCVYFIRDVGVDIPHLFGQDAEPERLQLLKETFSTAPHYGKELDWSGFSVYDAADLILLFLSELKKPLVSESVVNRWISLSKQATLPGSLAIRQDQCIDFWEEALGGIRGHSRSLFKLLLNLWGDIADAADTNDMTAERLAGRAMRALMHIPAVKYDTDYLLGLAFLIRKRSEYNVSVRGETRTSNAAF
ncbi:putative group protein [Diplogelasinospora grovesii]|uniref:Group protein n=1 Tax=Diplogelasinospora grovesii TaxID=303347 RepID=A0AAN6MZ62_9PEZI|nr:putative group protein [Diplogelasinospora grovesii]